jgi:D-alanyl-D-alanine carboxypeptidase
MLPSGNDASMALAIWGGRKLLEREQEPQSKFTRMECYNRFIQLMNSKAKELKMLKTNYANSHGLMNPNNKSSAYDLALLCEYAMNNESFRAIVRCKQYKGVVRFNEDSKKIEERTYKKESEEAASESDSPEERSPLMRQFSSIVNKNSEKRIAVEWENTHKLLHLKPKEYIGIKTGYTPSAGPCLSSFISTNNRNFVIIVLGCGRVSLRFKET